MSLSTRVRLGLLISLSVWLLNACAPTQPPASTPTQSSVVVQPTEVPAYLECDPQELPFPLPPDAKDCQHLDIITNFRTNLSPEQVVKFYGDYLEKNGWTRQDDRLLPGIGAWVTGSKRLNVLTAIEKDMTSVQIQVMPK